MDIRIDSMKVLNAPKPNRRGDTVVAYLDLRIEWLTLKGAALVRLGSDGRLSVWGPACLPGDGLRRVILSGEVRKDVVAAALPIFEALGGAAERVAAE